jgi:hypothetical protein
MLQRQLSLLKGHKLVHHQVQASFIFYVWLRVRLHSEYVYSHDFV